MKFLGTSNKRGHAVVVVGFILLLGATLTVPDRNTPGALVAAQSSSIRGRYNGKIVLVSDRHYGQA